VILFRSRSPDAPDRVVASVAVTGDSRRIQCLVGQSGSPNFPSQRDTSCFGFGPDLPKSEAREAGVFECFIGEKERNW
jgi:hypothetical protein